MMSISVGLDVSALDVAFKAHAGRGIGRYVSALRNYLGEQGYLDGGIELQNNGYLVDKSVNDRCKIGTFCYKDFTLPRIGQGLVNLLPAGRQTVRQQLCYPLQLGKVGRKYGFDVLHFPAHMDAPAWSPVPYIVTVLDLIPLVCEHLYRSEVGGWRFRLARFLELRAIVNARMVLAISECTARDVERLLGVAPEKIRVTPLGVDRVFFNNHSLDTLRSIKGKYRVCPEQPTLIYVGGIDARKNVPQLIRVFAELASDLVDSQLARPQLLIAGRIEDDRNYPLLHQLIKELYLEDDVKLLGYVPDEELRALVAGADLFVFPSLYEGFGLPPLEAMALGVPVVAQKNSSLIEVLGEGAHWFDLDDKNSAVRVLKELLKDSALRLSRIEVGRKQAQRFTWEHLGHLTLQAYEEYASEQHR
jgi:alpha-1,3-rhamnosyl/mannosyltransferase